MASNKHAGEGSSDAPLPLRPRHGDINAELPTNFHTLDEGTQGFIRDLLRQREEARRRLDAAQTNGIVIGGQLSKANTRVANLESQVQTLLNAARVARLVNVSGSTIAVRLRNIPSRVTEVAGHGAHEGATRAIVVVSTMSGADYRQFQPVFPEWGAVREEFEDLVDDLSIITDAIVDDVSLEGVVSNVFGEELD